MCVCVCAIRIACCVALELINLSVSRSIIANGIVYMHVYVCMYVSVLDRTRVCVCLCVSDTINNLPQCNYCPFCLFSSTFRLLLFTLRKSVVNVLCAHNVTYNVVHIIHTYVYQTHIYIHTSVQKNSSQYKEAIRTKMHFNRKSISCPLGQLCTDNCLNSIYVCTYMYICIQYIRLLNISYIYTSMCVWILMYHHVSLESCALITLDSAKNL